MEYKLTLEPTLPLPNSTIQIPLLGFGVYNSHGEACIESIHTALKAGYRHIDTAQYEQRSFQTHSPFFLAVKTYSSTAHRSYENETEVGAAITSSGIPRSELFITSKIRVPAADGAQDHYSSVLESIQRIDPGPNGYVDLFLIHSPKPPADVRRDVWFALGKLLAEGKVRSIGVSNWDVSRIEEMKSWGERPGAVWPPMVNQIELHPFCQQKEIVSYCRLHDIVLEAYCPLVRNQRADDPILLALAKRHKKATTQILIRYCLQKGWVPLPRSSTASRIEQNRDVYCFELTEEDMAALDGLDEGSEGAIVWAVHE
ncbi:putative oxidoreductase [Lachnellula suecica]|uniref:Putative oxidoreductase n=1 Tax=Lachnellula suecica TaxID=602035 RepID=A0A8T9C1X6_9HELO|nr:putative oxidoreductase [Lachnellula suecica]